MKTICWNCSNFIWIWLKNDREFSDDKLTEDTAIVDEVIGQYNDMKSELEP